MNRNEKRAHINVRSIDCQELCAMPGEMAPELKIFASYFETPANASSATSLSSK
jgi:hypothetical protein